MFLPNLRHSDTFSPCVFTGKTPNNPNARELCQNTSTKMAFKFECSQLVTKDFNVHFLGQYLIFLTSNKSVVSAM